MGAWGTGVFDNDGAGDLLAQLRHAAPDEREAILRGALESAADADDYLENPEAQAAVAAAAVVAAAIAGTAVTGPRGELLAAADVPAEAAALAPLARRALTRVVGERSEWRELWEEVDDLDEPTAAVEAVRAGLGEPDQAELLELARAGAVDDLYALADFGAGEDEYDDDEDEAEAEDGDALAYKWLWVASDFGHSAADELIDTLLEASSLRYDDDQFVTGEIHLDLGVAYLRGGEGLPVDFDKARRHLTEAVERGYPASIEQEDEILDEARASLGGEALAVFNEIYPG